MSKCDSICHIAEDWPEKQRYLLTLLAHRSKQIRDEMIRQLLKRNNAAELVIPYLNHRCAHARLAAIAVLEQTGGDSIMHYCSIGLSMSDRSGSGA